MEIQAYPSAMPRMLSAAQREQAMYDGTELGRWVLELSELKGAARSIALTLSHEYQFVNQSGDYTATLTQGRTDLAQFAGCSIWSVAGANKMMVELDEWEVIPGIGVTLTAYRPSQRVIHKIRANKKGE